MVPERKVQEPRRMVILLIMRFEIQLHYDNFFLRKGLTHLLNSLNLFFIRFAKEFKMRTGMLSTQIQEAMDLMLIPKMDYGSVMMTKILLEKR